MNVTWLAVAGKKSTREETATYVQASTPRETNYNFFNYIKHILALSYLLRIVTTGFSFFLLFSFIIFSHDSVYLIAVLLL